VTRLCFSLEWIIIGVTTGVGFLLLVAITGFSIWYFCFRQPARKMRPKNTRQAWQTERF
jgi:hypothetical protein